jgi:eukaryotic translation initiation factor 2C
MASKHHNTRFCAKKESRLQIGKSKNVPAGSVIDQSVVTSDMFDFFLCSSQGIQGTSIPTHYYVLHDDNELTADSAQVNNTRKR